MQAHAAAGEARVAGMTGTGVITPGGAIESGCSAVAFDASVPVGIGTALLRRPARRRAHCRRRSAGRRRSRGEPCRAPTLRRLRVGRPSRDRRRGLRNRGWAHPARGGAAGGDTRAQFADGWPLSGSVVAVAIASQQPIGVGISHGCVPRGTPSIVTRSHGRVLLQLDGRPAEAVYLEKIGVGDVPLSDDDFEAIAMAHPLAQPELRGDVRPRYVRGRMPGGGLVCATSIEANAAVDVCEQTPEAIVRSAVDGRRRSRAPFRPCRGSSALRLCCKERAVRQSARRARSSRLSRQWDPPPQSQVPTHGERSAGSGVRKETATIASSSLHSVHRVDRRDELLRRFVEAARRAQIVTIVNTAASEAELGELFTAELCEAFAEIAFVLTEPHGAGSSRTRWRLRSRQPPACRSARRRKLCPRPEV